MKKFILISVLLVALSSTLLSCGSPPSKVVADTSSTDGGGSNSTASNDALLFISVASNYESETSLTQQGNCEVNSLTSNNITCTIKVPEGQMYFSDFKFTVGSKISGACPIIVFRPYYYRISNDDNYTPPSATSAVKCATEPNEHKECWGGAGPHTITGFPKNLGEYFTSSTATEKTWTLPAENTTRWYSSAVNYTASNNMLSGARSTPINGVYYVDTTSATTIANTQMQDYVALCKDTWYHTLYSITLNLYDEDTKSQDGTLDEIPDWQ